MKYSERTITERLAKRIKRGQDIGKTSIPNELLLKWAEQYAICRAFGVIIKNG